MITNKKNEALLRGFLNIYEIHYQTSQIEYSENDEFIIFKDLIHSAYPEFKFNLLISSEEYPKLDPNILNKYIPLIVISRNKPSIPKKYKSPFFIISTFYDPSFIELYSFMERKRATWPHIDDDLIIKNDDIEDIYALDELIKEEKRNINFQNDNQLNLGKIEQLINRLYKPPEGVITGKLIKPFLESEKVEIFSPLKSPVKKIIKQLHFEGIGTNIRENILTEAINNNLDENYVFSLNSFKYESLLNNNNQFSFFKTPSCRNLYNLLLNLRSLKLNEQQLNSVYKSIHIMIEHGRDSKKEILNQYYEFFQYLGLIQDNQEGEFFFPLVNPKEFINKLFAFFDIIRAGISQFRRDFEYLEPLLNATLLSESDLENVSRLLQNFKEISVRIDPDIKNIDENLKNFCLPLLIFTIILGFSIGRRYFIDYCETEGEFQNKMTILTTPVVEKGGSITDSVEKNLEVLFETVKIEKNKIIKKRGFEIKYIEILSLKQKHDLLLDYGKYLKETIESLKSNLDSYISEIQSSSYASIFIINTYQSYLNEIDILKPKFALKNTFNPSLNRLSTIEDDTDTIHQKWRELNTKYEEVNGEVSDYLNNNVLKDENKFEGCTNIYDEYQDLKNEITTQYDELDQLKDKLKNITSYDLKSYENNIKSIFENFEKSIEKYAELHEKFDAEIEEKKINLILNHALILRANKFSDKNVRDDNLLDSKFLEIDDKNCGNFTRNLSDKLKIIKDEGNYLTSDCWSMYYELLKDVDIEKLQDYGKRIQLPKKILDGIDQNCLARLIEVDVIKKEEIVVFKA